MCWNLIRLYSYADFKKKRIELPSLERTEEIRNELEDEIIKQYTSHPSLKVNLEKLLNGIKFQERILKELYLEYGYDHDSTQILHHFKSYKAWVEISIKSLTPKGE
ncbi:hypothetical protein BWD12_20155 [Leptospira santarosai serovar Bananal]|nr:hypothetical protein BV917_20065 [Leptospira santarosai serovar Guaricura]OLY62400.1 hypothetical protein BWD11_20265 [Leptospira santarosai serovar Grippotyphosa]ONF75781.1 hypothetical protein BWD12_20155 [Leptospira santarosai serovar Bananal]ONF83254.1 hypothetical protein BWD13_19070 [Leptospira santarosai serovar Grippotyphosa]